MKHGEYWIPLIKAASAQGWSVEYTGEHLVLRRQVASIHIQFEPVELGALARTEHPSPEKG